MSDGKLVQPSKGRLAFLAAQEMKYYIVRAPMSCYVVCVPDLTKYVLRRITRISRLR